jgi:CRP-like cAMP-binding protein
MQHGTVAFDEFALGVLLRILPKARLLRRPAHDRRGHRVGFTYNEWLAKVFPRLKKSQLAEISRRLQPAVYEAGDIIFRQGTKADRFYIIAAGEVSVIHRTSKGDEVELARLGAGEVFGEMGILTETRRSADVRADTAVSLFALDWEDFKEVIERSDPTARDFMEIVAQRRAALPGATF